MSSNNKLEYKDGDGLAKSSLKSPSSLSRTMQFRMNTWDPARRTLLWLLHLKSHRPLPHITHWRPTDKLTKSILLKAIVDSRNVVSGISNGSETLFDSFVPRTAVCSSVDGLCKLGRTHFKGGREMKKKKKREEGRILKLEYSTRAKKDGALLPG